MMRRSNWIKCVVAVSLCLTIVSCKNDSGSTSEKKFVDNFKALVMGGKEIDSYQDWNTVGSASVRVGVDFDDDNDYTVYISQTPLIFDTKAVYIGMAKLTSGESKTINIPRPANAALLYAACYDADGHAVSKPFVVSGSDNEVLFSGMSPAEAASYSSTSGNAWSVPERSMPNLSAYTTGTLVNPTDDVELNDDLEVHYQISSDFRGFLPALGTFTKKTVYVTATWTLTFNQQVLRDNILIVGSGGKVVIPESFKLSSAPLSGESAGQIFVLPGGQIVGEGALELATSGSLYSYNAGTISVMNVTLAGGTLYNSGTLGTSGSTSTRLIFSTGDNGGKSMLINAGTADLTAVSGEAVGIQNAGNLKVNGALTLSEASRMDDGSYTECSSLTLSGDAAGGKVLSMGNAAYMNCKGNVSIDNFGVCGPSGNAFKANAVLKVNGCSYCATTSGVEDTYLLDHVELIVPGAFPTVFDNGALNVWDGDKRGIGIGKLQESFSGYYNLCMLYHWLNGYDGSLLDVSNYRWGLSNSKYCLLWSGAANNVDASRQTCTYSTSPSYDYAGHATFRKAATGSTPNSSSIYYLFETIQDNTKDFDYNDVVLRVNTPYDNGDGTFTSSVQVMCVGNTISTTVLYNGEPFGEEVHSAIGTAVTTPVNTNSVSRTFRKLSEITFTGGDYRTDALNFSLSLEDANGDVSIESMESTLGEAPLYVVVNGNNTGKYFWPVEGSNIGIAYPQFSTWASNVQTAIDWYDSGNATSNKVVSY